jgi:hypothetical protein
MPVLRWEKWDRSHPGCRIRRLFESIPLPHDVSSEGAGNCARGGRAPKYQNCVQFIIVFIRGL